MTETYVCSNCGADIEPGQIVCPECGSEIVWEALAEPAREVRIVKRRPRIGRQRGPRWDQLLLFGLIAIVALVGILMAGLWMAQQSRYARPTRSVAPPSPTAINLPANTPEPATAVVIIPTPAPEIATAAVEIAPTAEPTPTPATLNEAGLADALTAAQLAFDLGDWLEAVAQLRLLHQDYPDYQAALIEQMLFDALFNLAQRQETAGDLAAAARTLAEALSLRPEQGDASSLQQKVQIYETGVAALGQDWAAAIDAFAALFALAPDFRDTPQQLFRAYVGAAESLHDAQPCAAVERYQQALQIQRDPQVRARLEDARLRCGDASPTPPAADTPTRNVGLGQIAYTYFDDVSLQHNIGLWDANTQTTGPLAAEAALQPSLGPDNAIVARSTDEQSDGLVIFNQPGAFPQRLTKQAEDNRPRWSPDGRSVLFDSASRTGDAKSHLFVIDVATREVRDLGLGSDGAWSPDGRQIVFQGCDPEGEACGLWAIDSTGGRRRRLTTVSNDSMPSWSPDGRMIAFMSSGRSPSPDIFVADADTGNVSLFSLDAGNDGLPVWSPDGKSIAFLSDRAGNWAVYRWSLDDLSVDRLFDIPGALPAWQEATLDWQS